MSPEKITSRSHSLGFSVRRCARGFVFEVRDEASPMFRGDEFAALTTTDLREVAGNEIARRLDQMVQALGGDA